MRNTINGKAGESTNGLSAIEAHDFGLTFIGDEQTPPLQILRDINLTVAPGEILTFIGPSGCGKTTLLRTIAGLLTQEDDNVLLEGSMSVYGLQPVEAKKCRMFAFTFQNPVLLPWRTVRQNVNLPLEIVHEKESQGSSIINEMLSIVGINDFSGAMSTQISGGMQQRVNLARALVQKPRILLMDEPFGSLDEITRERLNFELLRIQRLKKQTILFVTHSISEAVLLADRVLILSERPATIRESIPIELPKERTPNMLLSNDYLSIVRSVRDIFGKVEASV